MKAQNVAIAAYRVEEVFFKTTKYSKANNTTNIVAGLTRSKNSWGQKRASCMR